jgi:hypothetical protein
MRPLCDVSGNEGSMVLMLMNGESFDGSGGRSGRGRGLKSCRTRI